MKKVFAILLLLILLIQPAISVFATERLQMTAQKSNQSPKIDGIITEEEWGEPITTFSQDSDNIWSNNAQVDEARLPTEAKLYAMWDDEYLYLGVIVVSLDHRNNKRNAHIWEDDSLSLKLGLAANQNAEYRFIFSLGGGNIPLGYLLCLPNEMLNGTSIPLEILLHYSDYCVARTDNETTYEVRIKWDDYTVDERKIEKGFQFYLEVGLHTKGKKTAIPRTMVYGTYDDSRHWQYPQVTLDEQAAVLSPTPELTPTATTTDSLGLIRSPSVTAVASASLKTPKQNSDTYLWWCLLFLILLELLAVIILIKIKKRNHTSR